MKTSMIFTMILSLMLSVSFAQEDTTAPAADTGDVEVVISPKDGQDSTIVTIAGMKIIVLNDRGKERVIIDGEEIDMEDGDWEDGDDDDEKEKKDKINHWSGIGIGVNGYFTNYGDLPLAGGDRDLELDYGRSVSWDLNLFEKAFRLIKHNVELVTGLGFHFANYTFNSQFTTLQPTVPFSYATDSTKNFTKNKLKASYLTAPLLLGFATNKDEDKAFRVAIGAQASWRINSKLKQQYNTANGDKNTLKFKGDYDLNPFLFHAVTSIGYGPVNVFAKYGLNPLFQDGRTNDALRPFDLGVQLMF